MRILANVRAEAVTDYMVIEDMDETMTIIADTTLNVVYACPSSTEDVDKESIKAIAANYPERFIAEVSPNQYSLIDFLNKNNIKWCSYFTSCNFRTLKILKNMGAASFKIGGELLNRLDDVVATIGNAETPIFINPIPYLNLLEVQHDNPIASSWINPKHMAAIVKKYPQIGVVFDPWIYRRDASAYISIYSTGIWNDSLTSLLKIDKSPDIPSFPLSLLPEEFTLTRLNCGRRCDIGACHYCNAKFNEIDLYLKNAELFKKKE
mgnify:CR=1 FL=1